MNEGVSPLTCMYCSMDSAGNHEPQCPFYPGNPKGYQVYATQYGWICPKCGAVYGPMKVECVRCNPGPRVTWI